MRSIFSHLQYEHPHTLIQYNTMALATATSTRPMSTKLQAASLSVPDELYWYNNHTNWDALNRKEFRDVMVRMESITAQHY